MVTLTLKDGNTMQVDNGTTVLEVAEEISPGLARMACAGEVDGELVDLRLPLEEDVELAILTFDSDGGRHAYRHTAAHILAQAVKRIYPDAKLAIGPAIKDGFYYDIDVNEPITDDDLEKIEAEMNNIIKEDLPIERYEMSRNEALEFYKEQGEDYKVELIEDLPEDEIISFYKQGEFTDLCAGPHMASTKDIKAMELTSVAGAYWRGDEKNKMLTRIYGTAFWRRKDLNEHLEMLEEAKRRDHRKLGRELEIFLNLEEAPGMPFFLPHGVHIRNKLMELLRRMHKEAGYQEVSTPQIMRKSLWETSGHWGHYQDNMYVTEIEDDEYAIKPMNCPGGNLLYKQRLWSYRDLPYRMAEFGNVHRHEMSGTLHGLLRVRRFTQDDAHLYMTPDQITSEVVGAVKLIDELYSNFGFNYHLELSTRPDDSMGSDEDWEIATNGLRDALEEWGADYVVNEGDGAFYGPKIDFIVEDSLGREWQCGTVQLDLQQPERFELEYIGQDGDKHRPIMIHRAAYGSLERFMGILIEHYAGKFPMWLAPEQVRILPISEHVHDYAKEVEEKFEEAGLLVTVDDRSEKVGYKIREARNMRIPYMLVVGEREKESGEVSVRSRENGEEGTMKIDDLISRMQEEIDTKYYNFDEAERKDD